MGGYYRGTWVVGWAKNRHVYLNVIRAHIGVFWLIQVCYDTEVQHRTYKSLFVANLTIQQINQTNPNNTEIYIPLESYTHTHTHHTHTHTHTTKRQIIIKQNSIGPITDKSPPPMVIRMVIWLIHTYTTTTTFELLITGHIRTRLPHYGPSESSFAPYTGHVRAHLPHVPPQLFCPISYATLPTYIHTYIHTQTHTYIHTQTHTYTLLVIQQFSSFIEKFTITRILS